MNRERRTHPKPRPEIDVRWQDDAACASAPIELFFPEIATAGEWNAPRIRQLVSHVTEDYCAGCPVRRECIAHALTEPERDGIWAGFTPPQRQNAEHPNQLLPAQEASTA